MPLNAITIASVAHARRAVRRPYGRQAVCGSAVTGGLRQHLPQLRHALGRGCQPLCETFNQLQDVVASKHGNLPEGHLMDPPRRRDCRIDREGGRARARSAAPSRIRCSPRRRPRTCRWAGRQAHAFRFRARSADRACRRACRRPVAGDTVNRRGHDALGPTAAGAAGEAGRMGSAARGSSQETASR
jgi:hypothetical protein